MKQRPRKTTTTRLTRMVKLITLSAKCINPHVEPPWQRLEHDHDICNHIQFYLPINEPGTLVKLDWAKDHANLVDKNYEMMMYYLYTQMAPYPTTKAHAKLVMG